MRPRHVVVISSSGEAIELTLDRVHVVLGLLSNEATPRGLASLQAQLRGRLDSPRNQYLRLTPPETSALLWTLGA